jgi:hypothetical protein
MWRSFPFVSGDGFKQRTLECALGDDGTEPSPKSTGEDSARTWLPSPLVPLERQPKPWYESLRPIQAIDFLKLLFERASPDSPLELRLAREQRGGRLLLHAFRQLSGQIQDAALSPFLDLNSKVHVKRAGSLRSPG